MIFWKQILTSLHNGKHVGLTTNFIRNKKNSCGLLLLVAAMFAMPMQAQKLKISVNKKGKVGFVDKTGQVVVDYIYDSALPFSNGVSIVSKSGKSGIIDTAGNELLPLKYTQISSWSPDVYLIKNNQKMGLVTRQGEILLEPKYSQISKPNSYGKALIALGGKAFNSEALKGKVCISGAKYGIIDTKGTILIEPKYKGLYEFDDDGKNYTQFHEGVALKHSLHFLSDTLATNCEHVGYSSYSGTVQKSGVLSGDGTILVKSGLYDYVLQPVNGMVRYYNGAKGSSTVCGYHDISTDKGIEVAKFDSKLNDIKVWTHGDFVGNFAPVNDGTSWSFVDKTGAAVRTGFGLIRHVQHVDLWAAREKASGKWQVFDNGNQNVSALSGYDDFLFPVNMGDEEVFVVKKDEKYGCVNRSGSQVVPFDYELAGANSYGIIPVKQNGKWGAVSPTGEVVVPVEFIDMLLPSERGTKHFWVRKSDSLYYHYNASAQTLAQNGYKAVVNFKNGVALVAPADMKMEDCMLVRAQTYAANTAKATLYGVDLAKCKNAFGYIVADNDKVLIDQPVSTLYVDAVMKKLAELGNRVPTEIEKKNILLEVTRENRSYELKEPIGEEEWNY